MVSPEPRPEPASSCRSPKQLGMVSPEPAVRSGVPGTAGHDSQVDRNSLVEHGRSADENVKFLLGEIDRLTLPDAYPLSLSIKTPPSSDPALSTCKNGRFSEVFCNLAPSSVVLGHGFSQKARVFDGFPC